MLCDTSAGQVVVAVVEAATAPVLARNKHVRAEGQPATANLPDQQGQQGTATNYKENQPVRLIHRLHYDLLLRFSAIMITNNHKLVQETSRATGSILAV